MRHRDYWVIEGPYEATLTQIVIAGTVLTLAWIGVGVSIGWWIWGG